MTPLNERQTLDAMYHVNRGYVYVNKLCWQLVRKYGLSDAKKIALDRMDKSQKNMTSYYVWYEIAQVCRFAEYAQAGMFDYYGKTTD